MNAPYRFDVFEGKNGWRWRVRARNAKIVADCAESYKTRRAALTGVVVVTLATMAPVIDPNGNPIGGGL